MQELTHQSLLECLFYDPTSGVFTWLKSNQKAKAGNIAGSLTTKGYITIKINGKAYKAHRLAWLYSYGVWPVGVIDHKNGVKNDNRLLNLRDVTQRTNMENVSKSYKGSGTDFLGVSFVSRIGKFKAQITVNGVKQYLGVFLTPEEAHVAYLSAKERLHPGFISNKQAKTKGH